MTWTWMRYQVLDIQDDIYTVCDENNEQFQFRLHFYDLELSIGDFITISNYYLYEFTQYGLTKFYFGPMDTKFSKKLKANQEHEKMSIEHNGELFIYQRYYG